MHNALNQRINMKILLDTNFLFIPFTLKADVFSQFRNLGFSICVIDRTVEELENLKQNGDAKEKKASKMALEAITKLNIEVLHAEERLKKVDESILDVAAKRKLMVATQDKELKRLLKEKGIRVYYLRQRKYVTEE